MRNGEKKYIMRVSTIFGTSKKKKSTRETKKKIAVKPKKRIKGIVTIKYNTVIIFWKDIS